MILIKESRLNRVVKCLEGKPMKIAPGTLTKERKKGNVPCYYGRLKGECSNDGYYYEKEFLEEILGVKIPMRDVDGSYYIDVKNPEEEGLEYKHPKRGSKDISDLVSAAAPLPS